MEVDKLMAVRLECAKLCGPVTRADGLELMLATAETLVQWVVNGKAPADTSGRPSKGQKPR